MNDTRIARFIGPDGKEVYRRFKAVYVHLDNGLLELVSADRPVTIALEHRDERFFSLWEKAQKAKQVCGRIALALLLGASGIATGLALMHI